MADELMAKMDLAAEKLLGKLSLKSLEVSENPADNSGTAEILSVDQEIKIFEVVGKWLAVKHKVNPTDDKESEINDFKRELKASGSERAGDTGPGDTAVLSAAKRKYTRTSLPAGPTDAEASELDAIKQRVRGATNGGAPGNSTGAGGPSPAVGGAGRRVSIGVPLGSQPDKSDADGVRDL